MLFLVKFDYTQPDTMSDEEWRQILTKEGEHGNEAIRCGKLEEIYLAAGTNTAFCLFEVASAEDLHQCVTTLPLFRYSEITTYPLLNLGEIKRKSLNLE